MEGAKARSAKDAEGVRPTDTDCDEECRKTLDANRYATKKTIAQGMLDIALLTANASQLKYILQAGKEHEFYTLMVTLISVSIILQAIQGILCVVLGSTLDINKTKQQRTANSWNNFVLLLNILITAVNVVLGAFDMRSSDMMPIAGRAGVPALPPAFPTEAAPASTTPAPSPAAPVFSF